MATGGEYYHRTRILHSVALVCDALGFRAEKGDWFPPKQPPKNLAIIVVYMENQENAEKENPNSIGEIVSVSRDIETFPNRVYRSVKERAAIDDLITSGVVRNKQSAGVVEKNRWGENVYWSRGEEGKFHIVQSEGYVIEAPYNIAIKRQVTIDDVTAIYHKTSNGEILDILDEVISDSL